MLSLAFPFVAAAQGPAPSVLWQRPITGLTSTGLSELELERSAPDHRWEGMAIGAGAGALAFGLLGAVVCSQSEGTDSCTGIVIGAGLLGAFVGGITGGLIGGAIPKDQAASTQGTRRLPAGQLPLRNSSIAASTSSGRS